MSAASKAGRRRRTAADMARLERGEAAAPKPTFTIPLKPHVSAELADGANLSKVLHQVCTRRRVLPHLPHTSHNTEHPRTLNASLEPRQALARTRPVCVCTRRRVLSHIPLTSQLSPHPLTHNPVVWRKPNPCLCRAELRRSSQLNSALSQRHPNPNPSQTQTESNPSTQPESNPRTLNAWPRQALTRTRPALTPPDDRQG